MSRELVSTAGTQVAERENLLLRGLVNGGVERAKLIEGEVHPEVASASKGR